MKIFNIKEKSQKNEGGVPITLPICQLLTILDYRTWYQIKVFISYFNPKVRVNDLLCIFMNINEIARH